MSECSTGEGNELSECSSGEGNEFWFLEVQKIGFHNSTVNLVHSCNTCYILQELNVDRELGGIETLQIKAVNYHSVDSPFLMPLDAFFVKVFTLHQELCHK